eukprot:2780299-Rhodomonas_salina.1
MSSSEGPAQNGGGASASRALPFTGVVLPYMEAVFPKMRAVLRQKWEGGAATSGSVVRLGLEGLGFTRTWPRTIQYQTAHP